MMSRKKGEVRLCHCEYVIWPFLHEKGGGGQFWVEFSSLQYNILRSFCLILVLWRLLKPPPLKPPPPLLT